MYKILTKASIDKITGFHWCTSICDQFANFPGQLAPIAQTSNICTKRINAQMGCVANVDSYSLNACTYVAGVRDTSKIVCYHQVLFAVVTKLQQ